MKISVIGTGYVGLVTGTCLAETGNNVLCIDIDESKVKQMKQGIVPIYEPHLDVLFQRNIKASRLNFSTSLEEGLVHGDIIFLALPTLGITHKNQHHQYYLPSYLILVEMNQLHLCQFEI